MSVFIFPESMRLKLATATGRSELYGPDGRLVGYFTPADEMKTINLDPGISEEELDARFAAGGGRPLADILRDLENRA